MKSHTDSQLISAYIQGNENALAQLISRHQKEIFAYIYFKLNQEDAANDIFQDTFVKIILTLKEGRYTDEGKFLPWAKRIAHNLIIDEFRRRTKQQNISGTGREEDDFSIFDTISTDEKNIEEKLVEQQINADLHKMVAHLPASQQQIIRQRFYDNQSFREIAEEDGSSINTALGRMRYAITNLRKMMSEHQIQLNK